MIFKKDDLMRLLILLLIAGCASLNEDQCKTGDWKGIGLSDGLEGLTFDHLSRHQKACSEYGISIDSKAYTEGRQEGLKTYCEPQNGYQLGLKGQSYNNVCTDKAFNENYKLGKKIHEVQTKITNIDNQIENLEQQMVVSNDQRERSNLHSQIKSLKRDKNRLDNMLLALKATRLKTTGDLIDLL